MIDGEFDFKPGDLIEWAYRSNRELVVSEESFWSLSAKNFVPIGSKYVHMVVAYDGDKIVWYNKLGLHSASFDQFHQVSYRVFPRKLFR